MPQTIAEVLILILLLGSALFYYLYNNANVFTPPDTMLAAENRTVPDQPLVQPPAPETTSEPASAETTLLKTYDAEGVPAATSDDGATTEESHIADDSASGTPGRTDVAITDEPTVTYEDIGALLSASESTAAGNKISAYQQLFAAWGQRYDSSAYSSACRQANLMSLSCLHKQGNLNSLKTHKRPAVLKLTDDKGISRYATITAIDGELATLHIDNKTYTVRLSDIDRHWYGQFTLLWKKPAGYKSAITPGKQGVIINWLYAQINDSETGASEINNYDTYLVDEVKKFQTRYGLTADGIVGPLTIIYLNTQNSTDVPTLTGKI
ncbi:MAG: peptidoglycan-binding protein [Proteobacteria bacterium]|nr:peptidoglycan-binding protein [Pseudomonadota bacterium]